MATEPKRELPFKIDTCENPVMRTHDLMLQVGGFISRTEAEDFAKVIVQFLEDNADAWSARVQ